MLLFLRPGKVKTKSRVYRVVNFYGTYRFKIYVHIYTQIIYVLLHTYTYELHMYIYAHICIHSLYVCIYTYAYTHAYDFK